ncbi:hypothetical protein [Mycobacteroides abscessus]|uniref:hypothetical protein n=1 Tax=Mycobacteroides abscessus TaxID=36809 RepID=UPI0012FF4F14|nr:hypothetical protein [Mycobacteroides abscessus]
MNWRYQDEVQETTPAACTSPDNTCGKPHACRHTPLAVMPGEIFSKFIQQGGTNIHRESKVGVLASTHEGRGLQK